MDTQPARQCEADGCTQTASHTILDGPAPDGHDPLPIALCTDHLEQMGTSIAICEVHLTVNDNDEGGPYNFVPCEQPATRIIHWTTDQGLEITLGLCDFHATGEL